MRIPSLFALMLTLLLRLANGEDGTGLSGWYYSNQDLTGTAALKRVDAQVNFDWAGGSPGTGIPTDHFSVRWMGFIQAPATQDLTIITRTDDGVRLWVDGKLVIDSWVPRSAADSTTIIHAQALHKYLVRMEYYEQTGSASASLLWQSLTISRQNIPKTALFPLPGVVASLPSASATSPACMEATNAPETAPSASALPGTTLPVHSLSAVEFYVDLPLSAQASTTLRVVSGATTLTQAVTWSPTTISGTAAMTIRAHDALLVKAPVVGTLQILNYSGFAVASHAADPAKPEVRKFDAPGTYTIIADDAHGVEQGSLVLTVIGVNLDGPIADQLGYQREKGVDITGGTTQNVMFSSADASLLQVSVKEATDYGARLYLTTLRRGTPLIVARLATALAPIVTTQAVDEYTIETPLTQSLLVNSAGIGQSLFTIRPLIPNLDVTLTTFAHRTTFKGGLTTLIASTNTFKSRVDPATGETVGDLIFEMDAPPGETSYCFRANLDQHSNHGTNTGTIGKNGCVITIMLTPDPGHLPFRRKNNPFVVTATAAMACPFDHVTFASHRKPGFKEGAAPIVAGNMVWAGVTNASHDLVLSTDPADGGQQTEIAGEKDVVLEVYHNGLLIASVEFCVSASIINFHQVGAGTANADGTLTFHYEWDSDSGVDADLDGCVVGEVVNYPGLIPRPPFTDPEPDNPTTRTSHGQTGAGGDTQGTLSPVKGTAVVNFTATQIYRYEDLRCDPDGTFHTLFGPTMIIRNVSQNAAGQWVYSVQKSGATATLVLP